MSKLSSGDDVRRWAWLGLLTAASVAFSLSFACAAPFAALVSLGALNMSRRDAFVLAGGVFLANQAIGFGLLDYGYETGTLLWGMAMGIGCLLTAWVALRTAHLAEATAPALRVLSTFAASSVAWEASMVVSRLFLSESGHLIDANVAGTVFAINAASFAGLLVVQWVGERVGIAPQRRPLSTGVGAP